MSLITVDVADIGEYQGSGVPTEFRLYANRDFIASDGTFIAKGSPDHNQAFYQPFGASLVGNKIRIASGTAYTTTDALDDDGFSTYTGVVFDANGRKLKTVVTQLRIPPEMTPVTWSQLVAFSAAKKQRYPATYLDSRNLLQILAGYTTAVVKATGVALGIVRLDTVPDDLNIPEAVGSNSEKLVNPAKINEIGHAYLDTEPDDPDAPIAVGINSTRILSDGDRQDITVDDSGATFLIREPQVKVIKDVYKHLSKSFGGSLSSVVTEAAANPASRYFIKVDATPNGNNLSLPPNLFLDFSLGYGINVPTAGQIVSITPPMNAPSHRLFTGSGQVRVQKSPGSHTFEGIWWLDDATGSTKQITAAQSEAMRYCQFSNLGSKLLIPLGTYQIDHEWVNEGHLEGVAANPNQYGTIIEQTTNGLAAIRIKGGLHGQLFRNLVISSGNLADSAQMLAKWGFYDGLTIIGIVLDNVHLIGGSHGIRFWDTVADVGGFQATGIYIGQNCTIQGQSVACYMSNAVNTGGEIYADMTPDANGQSWCYEIKGSGNLHIGSQMRGLLPENTGTSYSFVDGDVNVAADSITKAGFIPVTQMRLQFAGADLPLGLTAGANVYIRAIGGGAFTSHPTQADSEANTNKLAIADLGSGSRSFKTVPHPTVRFAIGTGAVNATTDVITRVGHNLQTADSFYWEISSGGDVPGTMIVAKKYYVRRIDADTFSVHELPAHAYGNTLKLDLSGMVGTATLISTRPDPAVLALQTLGCIHISGPCYEGITIGDCSKDEGFAWWIYEEEGINHATGTIVADMPNAQGQLKLNGIDLVLNGGYLLADSIKDYENSTAIVRRNGTRAWQFGNDHNNYAGYTVPEPWDICDFTGYSEMRHNDGPGAQPSIVERRTNDIDIAGVAVRRPDVALRTNTWRRRAPGAIIDGFWEMHTNETDPLYKGHGTNGSWYKNGRDLNGGRAVVNTVGSAGILNLNLQYQPDYLVFTPTEDTEIRITQFNTNYQQKLRILIYTSGSTSYNITFRGSDFEARGHFATGTEGGLAFLLEFEVDGAGSPKARETSRAGLSPRINVQTGTAYTVRNSDNGNVVTLNNAAAITVTVPVNLPVGFNVVFIQKGAGVATFVGAGGVTIVNRQSHSKTAGAGAVVSLVSDVANNLYLAGDTSA